MMDIYILLSLKKAVRVTYRCLGQLSLGLGYLVVQKNRVKLLQQPFTALQLHKLSVFNP